MTDGINFGPNANGADVSDHSRGVLKAVMAAAGVSSLTVSSTARAPFDQARVMFDNIQKTGVAAQKKLYGPFGDSVIDVFVAASNAGKNRAETIAAMQAKIIEVGPSNVSHHAADPKRLNVFDVAPSSIPIARKHAWEAAIKANHEISKFIFPPSDPGYHFEIKQPGVA
jgi:hypothetical protein